MSKVVEMALRCVKESQFKFVDDRSIEILNAHIFWTNFSGAPDRFNNTARVFNVALSPEAATILRDMGFRIRESVFEDDMLFFVQIKVNMQSAYPPTVSLFSEFRGKKSKRVLTAESIGELDRMDIKSADLIANVYLSEMFPGKPTLYLQKLNIIQEPDVDFGGKYDDWMDEEYDCMAAGTCSIDEYNLIMAQGQKMGKEETEAWLKKHREEKVPF